MNERPPPVETSSLSLSVDAQWTLHHVLCEELDDESVVDTSVGEETRTELRRAFETLDAGGQTFTHRELDAIQTVVATYHHSATWWEVERPRLEAVLRQVSTRLDRA